MKIAFTYHHADYHVLTIFSLYSRSLKRVASGKLDVVKTEHTSAYVFISMKQRSRFENCIYVYIQLTMLRDLGCWTGFSGVMSGAASSPSIADILQKISPGSEHWEKWLLVKAADVGALEDAGVLHLREAVDTEDLTSLLRTIAPWLKARRKDSQPIASYPGEEGEPVINVYKASPTEGYGRYSVYLSVGQNPPQKVVAAQYGLTLGSVGARYMILWLRISLLNEPCKETPPMNAYHHREGRQPPKEVGK